jgi:hypothetical protein
MRGYRKFLLASGLTLLAESMTAQTTVNPDISVIPRFLISTDDGARLAEGVREFSRPDFTFQELELAVQAYLNPYAKGDIVLTVPGPDLETAKLGVEEVYATILRGLPGDLNIRIGKYRAEFGKLNMMHPHAWPFISQPLSAERFLGEEGLNDLGISVSALLPTGELYTRLVLDLLRGTAIGQAAGLADSSQNRPFYANSARLSSFFSLSDETDLEVGVSGYTGIHDPYVHQRFWYGNLDFKYKYRPSSYTSLTIQGEYLLNSRMASQDRQFHQFVDARGNPEVRSITTSGMYLYVDYQFLKTYDAGVRLDWTESPYSRDDVAHALSLFFGYYPVEETLGARLEYQHRHSDSPGLSRSINMIALQILFSLGPHKAHPF